MSKTTMTPKPDDATAIGFKSEDWTDEGHEMGPIFWITPDGLTPIGTDGEEDAFGEPLPIWDTRPNTIRQAKKYGLEVEEL